MSDIVREAVERAGASLVTDLIGCAAIVIMFFAVLHVPGVF